MDITLQSIIGYVEKNLDYFQDQNRDRYVSNLNEIKELFNQELDVPQYLISSLSHMCKEIYLKINREDLFKKINEYSI